MRPERADAWLTFGLLGFLAVALLLDLRVALRGDGPLASRALMDSARAVLLAQSHTGDHLVHSPLFTPTELEGLGAVRARPDLPHPEIRGRRRIVVLDREDVPIKGLGRPTKELTIVPDPHEAAPPLVVRVFEPTGGVQPVLFELLGEIDSIKMRIERPVGTVATECTEPRPGGGRNCPNQAEWLYLAAVSLVISGQSQSCVWAHPTHGGAIVLELPDQAALPPGRTLEMTLSGALSDDAARTEGGAPVETAVIQGGAIKGRLMVANQPGWQRTTIRVDAEDRIELRITTERDGRRHHCLNAEFREVAAP